MARIGLALAWQSMPRSPSVGLRIWIEGTGIGGIWAWQWLSSLKSSIRIEQLSAWVREDGVCTWRGEPDRQVSYDSREIILASRFDFLFDDALVVVDSSLLGHDGSSSPCPYGRFGGSEISFGDVLLRFALWPVS